MRYNNVCIVDKNKFVDMLLVAALTCRRRGVVL